MEADLVQQTFSTTKYSWRETGNQRSDYRGTIMPLSALCSHMHVEYKWSVFPMDKYNEEMDAGVYFHRIPGLHIKSNYILTPAGEIARKIQERLFSFERSRLDGAAAVRILGKNERLRQELRFKKLSQDPDVLSIKREFESWFYSKRIDSWSDYFYECYAAFEEVEQEGTQYIMDQCHEYMKAEEKDTVSYLPGMSYAEIINNPRLLMEGFLSCKNVVRQFAINPYRETFPSKETLLHALRNRPMDAIFKQNTWQPLDISDTMTEGDLIRSREAQGTAPFSHKNMYIYRAKRYLTERFINRLKRDTNVNFRTPIGDTSFFKDWINGVPGIYMFGDNLCFIEKDGTYDVMDLGNSEVYQGFFRQGPNYENLAWFVPLNEHVRQGCSGDAETTNWNIEGLAELVSIYLDNPGLFDSKLPGKVKIKGLLEPATSFLGLAKVNNKPYTVGFKLNTDNANKRIPHNFRMSGGEYSLQQTRTDYARAIQTIISNGLHDIVDLRWLYEHVVERKEWYDTDYELSTRIEEMLKNEPGLMDAALDIMGEDYIKALFPVI